MSLFDVIQANVAFHFPEKEQYPGALHDVLSIITTESGGNPYAINDNTTHKSYQFKTYQEASDYINRNSDHTMAIGLFQLLLHGGMGDQYKREGGLLASPTILLDPQTQLAIAMPEIKKHEQKAKKLPVGSQARFAAAAENEWLASTLDAGQPSQEKINATIKAMGANSETDTATLKGINEFYSDDFDDKMSSLDPMEFIQNLWSVNTLVVVLGSLVIVGVLINAAKEG